MNIRTQPVMVGNWVAALTDSFKEFATAKGGNVIETPGTPAPLNMSVVAVLGVAVVAVAVMKKKGVL